MHQRSDSTVLRRALVSCIAALVLVFTGATLTAGKELVQPDGRINQVAHFGGDAFYCVDSSFNATTNYAEMIDDGGFRLLDSKGQELWFVPAADILAAIDESIQANTGVLVAEGQGTHGPVRLFTYFDGETQQFIFNGYDEYGKPNSLMFSPCIPVGPTPDDPSSSSRSGGVELCVYEDSPYSATKLISPVKGVTILILVPCNDCPLMETSKLLAGKRVGGLVQGNNGYPYCGESNSNDR